MTGKINLKRIEIRESQWKTEQFAGSGGVFGLAAMSLRLKFKKEKKKKSVDECGGAHCTDSVKRTTGMCRICVCHCEDNWKNFTLFHSTPSMTTAIVGTHDALSQWNALITSDRAMNWLTQLKRADKNRLDWIEL